MEQGNVLTHAQALARIAELEAENAEFARQLKQQQQDDRQSGLQFLSHMSHEIRTPLNIILGYTDLLVADLQEARHQERLNSIAMNGRYLVDLLNRMLHFSRLKSNKQICNNQSISLQELCTHLEYMFTGTLSDKGLVFKTELDSDLPTYVLMDEMHLKEVLINLIGNAQKYAHAGAVTLSISKKDSALCFSLSDEGKGIDSHKLAHLFDPFEQAHQPTELHGSSGLGLAIAYQSVRLMGGTLQVRSSPGEGSTFFFEVPLVPANPADISDAKPATSRPEQQYRVLVVDDYAANRELIQQFLEHYPFEILEASNGREAIVKTRQYKPDIVLLDLAMPILDGKTTVEILRQQPDTAELPILVISAMAFAESQRSTLAAGANAFLAKPFKKEDLLVNMYDLLGVEYRPVVSPTGGAPGAAATTDNGDLIMPPVPWLDAFQALVKELDPMDVEEKLSEVKSSHPVFYAKVYPMVSAFAFSELENWLEEQLSS